MRFQIRAAVLTWLFILAAAGTSRAQNSCLDVIDFEALPEGAIVSSVTAAGGAGPVRVDGVNPLLGTTVNAAVLFDSACIGGCTGGDADLGTPNLDFGGPGSGAGGALGSPGANTIALGNILIVAEDLIDANADGLVDDPDDQGDQAVRLHLDFEALGGVILHELTIVDVDANRPPGSLTLLGEGGTGLLTVALPVTGNNGTAILDLFSTPGVRGIDVALEQSAAIDNIMFSVPCDDGDACTVDHCNGGGCVNEPIPGCVSCTPGEPCDDGDLCTINDTCVDGVCIGRPVQCDSVGGSDLPPGTTITTDPQGIGPTPEDPLTTTMTSPVGGDMAIAERLLPSGDLEFELLAPTNSPGAPLVIVSTLHASLGLPINVQYRKDGVPVPECTGAPGIADPDPCVGDRTMFMDSDIQVTIYSSMPGIWTFGPMDSCIDPATSQPLPDGTACDDGIFCNGEDTCLGGSCSAHAGDPCAGGGECADTCDESFESCLAVAGTTCTDDGNVCTDNICDGAGSCIAASNAATCDDGIFCNGADTCLNGECSVNAGDPCTGQPECADTCNEDLDTCFDSAGSACTDDGNECTDNTCDGAGSCVASGNTAPCDDGIFCNGEDTCMNSSCSAHAGNPCDVGTLCDEQGSTCVVVDCVTPEDPACDDGNSCTDDNCSVETGTCLNTPNVDPCDDGLFCNGIDACSAGSCSIHSGDPCENGVECSDTCDEIIDTCLVPAGTACTADGNECTDDVCDGSGTCGHPANTAGCDDSIFCNGEDSCADGSCSAHAGDPCLEGEICDEGVMQCLTPECSTLDDPACDDGNSCTDDRCNVETGTCLNVPNVEPCDDGLFCNGIDACSDGDCSVHSGDPCENGVECSDTCDETIDTCLVPAGTSCTADGNECTDDVCDGSGSCGHPANTATCDDSIFCNGEDSCADGSCSTHTGDPCLEGEICDEGVMQCLVPECTTLEDPACDDGNECTDDACNVATGECTSTPSTGPCTDDGNACTDDVCDGAGSCAHPDNTAPCDDSIFCNGEDTCADGACSTHTGDPCLEGEICDEPLMQCLTPECTTLEDPACDDGNECTDDACNVSIGECTSTPSTDPCTDDGNACTDDICNGAGSCAHPDNMAPCDDGIFCNGDDMCMDGSCSAHAGDPCLEGETCDETEDVCTAPPACSSGPRLIVGDVTCTVNADCSVTIELATDGAVVASAAATMETLASLSCGNQCDAGSAAPTGICFINPTLCRFAVANQIGTITPFEDGPIAILPVVCESEGTFTLELTDFSLGTAMGGVVPDVCSMPGLIRCTSGDSSVCAGPGDDAPCDDGLFCNGVETCQDGGCAAGTPPCTGDCNETTDECIAETACVDLSVGTGVSCPAGEDCTIPVFIDTGGLELGAVGAAIEAGLGLTCSSCAAGDAAGSASCFLDGDSCQLQVSALSQPAMPFADGLLAEVSVSCAAPTSGEICVGALDAFGVDGVVEKPVCEQVCVPYVCTPANQLCSSESDCDDGIECTIDCCSFDSGTSTLECRHEDNECSRCGDGPRLAGVDTLCTVGISCNVSVEVESGLDPIASIAGTLDVSAGLTVESLSLGACTAGSQTVSLGNPPSFSMAAPLGNAYCDGDAVIAQVRCDQVGVQTLEPAGISLGDDSMPLPLPICGGCGATASIVCVEPGLLIPCGDATLEGKLTSTDSLVVLRHSVGLADPCPRSICDVDISGDVTANDAMELLSSVVGLTTLACGDTQTILAPLISMPTSSTTSTTEQSQR